MSAVVDGHPSSVEVGPQAAPHPGQASPGPDKAALDRLRARGAMVRICGYREINFRAALVWLRKEWKVRRLLCEGGGELNDALLRAGLVNELHLTVCLKIIGGRNAPTIADGLGAASLAGARQFKLRNVKLVGNELFALFRAS